MAMTDCRATRRLVRSRHIRDAVNLPPIRLTSRDFELFAALASYRLLTTTQVRNLFFRSLHRARKRLFKLWQHKLVDRHFRAVALGEKPSDVIYALAVPGARLLAARPGTTEQTRPEARRIKRLSPLFLDHTLAVGDFRIALERSCRQRLGLRLLSWREGPEIRFEQSVIDYRRAAVLTRIPTIADGLICIEIDSRRHFAFVEVDRGTISLSRWRVRLAAYANATRNRALETQLGIGEFTVLVILDSEPRLRHLRQMAKPFALKSGNPQLFRFALLESFRDHHLSVFSPTVWSAAGELPLGPLDTNHHAKTAFTPQPASPEVHQKLAASTMDHNLPTASEHP